MNKTNQKYSDDDPYKNFFFTRLKQTVYKWWCVVYRPVYKLTHHGYWPEEKEPGYVPPENKEPDHVPPNTNETVSPNPQTSEDTSDIISRVLNEKQNNLNKTIASAHMEQTDESTSDSSQPDSVWDDSVDTSHMSSESVDLAKEIMERLAREAAEDEAKKQAEIAKAREVAAEKERLEEIMRSNQVDISRYIEEGKASQAEVSVSTDSDSNT
ncbi:MAG: hypothetical protein K2G45_05610 [Lachnospiraceae bacterium]|nr:hypothetical protein [Lachnospiraceae bacterium]